MADLTKLDKVINELEEQSNDLKEFNKVYSEIGKLKSDLLENLRILKENNDGFKSLSTLFHDELENSKQQFDQLEAALFKKIQDLYTDNKNFQKELDSSIVSRLEKNKSDIQVELRNEGVQIQRAFENTLTSKFNGMESKLKELFDGQTKQINTLKLLLFVVIGIGIALGIGLFMK